MITIRNAQKKDKNFIASSMVKASGGICEYLLSDIIAGIGVDRLLSFEVGKDHSPLSYKNCLIAEDKNGNYAGVVCAYDAEDFKTQLANIPHTKRAAVNKFYSADFPGKSFYIDTVFVSEQHQRNGIATQLLMHLNTFDLRSYQFLTLYVWETNLAAVSLYEKFGFQVLSTHRSDNDNFPISDERLLMHCKTNTYETHLNKLKNKGVSLLSSTLSSHDTV